MLGHLRLGEAEQLHEVVDGPFTVGEEIEDLPPPGLGHRVERVGCRRCAGHLQNIFPYRNVLSSTATTNALGDAGGGSRDVGGERLGGGSAAG